MIQYLLYRNIDVFKLRQSPFYILKLGIFQKIFGFNRDVPWLVHFSSIVTDWKNIEKKSEWLNPGVSPGCYIQAKNGIIFGENVYIGPSVKIISANHDIENLDTHAEAKPIIIGDKCWIGAGAIILPGVELGEKVIVGAGSVVTKTLNCKNCLIAGNPAKIVKNYTWE